MAASGGGDDAAGAVARLGMKALSPAMAPRRPCRRNSRPLLEQANRRPKGMSAITWARRMWGTDTVTRLQSRTARESEDDGDADAEADEGIVANASLGQLQ